MIFYFEKQKCPGWNNFRPGRFYRYGLNKSCGPAYKAQLEELDTLALVAWDENVPPTGTTIGGQDVLDYWSGAQSSGCYSLPIQWINPRPWPSGGPCSGWRSQRGSFHRSACLAFETPAETLGCGWPPYRRAVPSTVLLFIYNRGGNTV